DWSSDVCSSDLRPQGQPRSLSLSLALKRLSAPAPSARSGTGRATDVEFLTSPPVQVGRVGSQPAPPRDGLLVPFLPGSEPRRWRGVEMQEQRTVTLVRRLFDRT